MIPAALVVALALAGSATSPVEFPQPMSHCAPSDGPQFRCWLEHE